MDSNDNINEQIDNYYNSWFKINSLYHHWAKKHGIQDTTLFVLYVIKNTLSDCTQSYICNKLFLPKQTVSQILSILEKDGYIIKEANTNDRRNKIICFTKKGATYATSLLKELKSKEIEAFMKLTQEQRITIVEGFKLLTDSLSNKLLE